MMIVKATIVRLIACAVLGTMSAAHAELLLSYHFNEGTGTSAVNGGTAANGDATMYYNNVATNLHSAAGMGVSGQSGDYALDLSAANNMGNASSTNNSGVLKLSNPAIQNLTSFTLTCWMKTDGTEKIANAARLFNYVDGSNNGFFVNGSGTTGYVTATIDSTGFGNSDVVFTETNTWVFFAVSYDGTKTTNNLTFYKGTLDGTLAAAGTASVNAGVINTNTLATPVLLIGNNGGTGTGARPFDGWLDNVAVYGSTTDASGALSLSQLKDVMAVPEPAAIGMMMGGLAVMMRRKWT